MRIRRAEPADAGFVAELLEHEEVQPFHAPIRPRGLEAIQERIERSQQDPAALGVFVVEEDGRLAGIMEYEVWSARSRIANLGGLALHPDFRGRGIAEDAARDFQRHLLLDLGFHRLQVEVYGFNERGLRHAERSGFVREGLKRKAYLRHGTWVDGVTFAMIREDLGLPPAVDLLYEYVARLNHGVRSGDWEPLGELLAEGAVLEFDGVPVGPFTGREAIVAAYRERPPDHEVRILDVEEDGDAVLAGYAWATAPAEPAGRITLRLAGGEIAALAVTV